MVETMKALTKALGFKTLLGIPQKYQNKSRFIQSSHYDAIFAESDGQLKDYWELPLEIDRNLDEVPSKKRSMYRKRYAMLDDLAKVIEEKIRIVKVKSAVNVDRTFCFYKTFKQATK